LPDDVSIDSKRVDDWTSKVVIFAPGKIEVYSCPQRDLYRKYNWPAKKPMQKAVKAHLNK
jgi:hypothetical protein